MHAPPAQCPERSSESPTPPPRCACSGSPAPQLHPSILGSAVLGIELEAFSGIWVGSGLKQGYQWERCRDGNCTAISAGTRARYTPTADDGGHRLRVVTTVEGLGAAASAQTPFVETRPRFETLPTIVGTPRVGTQLHALRGRWQGANLRFEVFWQRCRQACERIARGQSYRVRPRDRGYSLRIEVIASNSVGTVRAVGKLTRQRPIAPRRSRGSASRAPRSAPARPGDPPRARREVALGTPRSRGQRRLRGCPRSAHRLDRAPRSRR